MCSATITGKCDCAAHTTKRNDFSLYEYSHIEILETSGKVDISVCTGEHFNGELTHCRIRCPDINSDCHIEHGNLPCIPRKQTGNPKVKISIEPQGEMEIGQ